MQQRSSRPTKTTSKVQKLLKDDGFRRSIEVSWQHNSAETEGLEVLARARALNEFIKKVSLYSAGQLECANATHLALIQHLVCVTHTAGPTS